MYIIYYGAWANTAAVENINYFVSNLDSSAWYATMKDYYMLSQTNTRTYVSGKVRVAQGWRVEVCG